MNKAAQRQADKARRALKREHRKMMAKAFFCRAPHPNQSQADHGRLCSFQIVPHRSYKGAMASCPRCGTAHWFNGATWGLEEIGTAPLTAA